MKQLRLFIFSVCACVICTLSAAQNLSTVIKTQAMDMATALMKNDFTSFIKYMHPNIIAYAGGREKMKTAMDSVHNTMQMFGASFRKYWIGSPEEIVNYNGQLQAILPESTIIKTPLGELMAETSMLAISEDGGKNWWFIDTNVYKADKLKNVVPGISPKLVIPPFKRPKFIPADSLNEK